MTTTDSGRHDASHDDDLIDRWLDEGDRLSESAGISTAGTTARKRHRVAEALGGLRALAAGRLYVFMVGAVAASAVAIFAMRARAHGVPEAERVVASVPPRPAAPPPPPEPVVTVPLPPPEPVAIGAPAREPIAFASEPEPPPPRPSSAAAVHDGAPARGAATASGSKQACQAALRRERVKEALVACEKVASETPASADALVLLAHAELLAGWGGDTLRLAHRAAFLDSRCADAYLLIGTVQQAAGRTSAARSAYESYLRYAPHGSHADEIRAILKNL